MWTPRGRLPGCSKKSLKYHARKRGGRNAALFCVAGKERLCLPQGRYILCRFPFAAKGRRFPKGDRKALWSRPQARNPLRLQTDTIKYFANNRTGAPQQSDAPVNLSHNKASDFLRAQGLPQAWGRRIPKGDRKALWSRPQARNPQRLQTDTIKYFANNRTGAPLCCDAPAFCAYPLREGLFEASSGR